MEPTEISHDTATMLMNTFRIAGGNHVIVDHVTVTWGMDGNTEVTFMDNATVQNSVLANRRLIERSPYIQGHLLTPTYSSQFEIRR